MTIRTYKTGQSRVQASLLPPRVEDYVGPDNPVRLIDAFVDGLDLGTLGFSNTDGGGGAGQPAFHPGDLLKLYLYGYTNRVRSSRRLEREAHRNLEVIWLLKGLTPCYRTISTFRRVNGAALKAMTRHLLGMARELDLLGGEVVAIDGAFFDGSASKASIITKTRLSERLAALERDLAAYDEALATNDAAEDGPDETPDGTPDGTPGEPHAPGRLAALQRQKAEIEASIAALEASGETQVSHTDPDARLLSKGGQTLAGYNVQIGVDAKHKLIVVSEVVNDGNDTGQLHAMAALAKEALGVETLTVVADSGYYNGATLKACEEDGIEAYVPEPERGGRAKAEGRFGEDDFAYDPASDRFRCPGKHVFGPCGGKRDTSGKWIVRYASSRRVCAACPLRGRCLTPKGTRREVWQWEHTGFIERHRVRMADSSAMLRQRKALVEHPFGTLKCRAGYRHFLVRGFAKVRGELALMVACYNVTRLSSILGFKDLMAALRLALNVLFLSLWHTLAALRAPQAHHLAKRPTKAIIQSFGPSSTDERFA